VPPRSDASGGANATPTPFATTARATIIAQTAEPTATPGLKATGTTKATTPPARAISGILTFQRGNEFAQVDLADGRIIATGGGYSPNLSVVGETAFLSTATTSPHGKESAKMMQMISEWERPAIRKLVAGAFALGLLTMAVYLMVGTLNREVALTAGLVVALALVLTSGGDARWHAIYRGALAVVGVFGVALPILVNTFAHISDERYLWVIGQHGVCAHLGSAAVLVTSGALGICFAFGSIGMLIATRRSRDPLVSPRATYVAGVLVLLLGVLVIATPDLVAAALCS